MRLNIVESKNARQYYVIESYRTEDGKNSSRIIEKLGSHEELLKLHEDPEAWARAYVEELKQKEKEAGKRILVKYSPNKQIEKDQVFLYEGGYLFLQKIFHQLRLDYICRKISKDYKFEYNFTEILAHLVYGRVLFPRSKKGTYEYSQKLLEKPSYELHDVYRALKVIAKNKDYIQSAVYKFSGEMGARNDRILYYDCTNFYFEMEEESGLCKYGPSKENRPNPIVEMGLFMDGDGIPLAFCIHEGNTNEQKTLIPLEKQIIEDFNHAKFIVCTDAGLSSTANRKFNNVADRAFITVQSIKKMKDFQKEWALSPEGWHLPGKKETFNLDTILSSEESIEQYKNWTFYKEEWFNENDIEQRYIVTFDIKYMLYMRHIRSKQIERAQKAIDSSTKRDRTRKSDYKRYITKVSVTSDGEVASETIYALNEEKIMEEEKYDGFYAVATNLEDPVESIIRANRRRWEIEESFRIMKSEFKSRPVYVSLDECITAHFTTCYLALIVYRYLEKALGNKYTCEEILSQLQEMKFYKIPTHGYLPAYTRTDFTDDLHEVFGFRTDYEILSKSTMRSIISATKKK